MENTIWYNWNNRNKIPKKNQPGVYFLAITNKDISSNEFSLIPEIIYIGMTISQSGIKGRLDQFERTMKRKNETHGGAQRVRFKHQDYELFFKNLYVSVCSFPLSLRRDTPEDWKMKGECAKHEYVSFATYLEKYGQLPEFNDHLRSKKK